MSRTPDPQTPDPVDVDALMREVRQFLQESATTPARTAPSTASPEESEAVRTPRSEWLRYVPPIAALSTAAVLQVVAVTDLLGEVLADRQTTGPQWVWYAVAGLLGVAFASCVEGGAAYLMDLYDKHLLARDSVWVLRAGMVVYVAGSAALIHWWLSTRGLPELIAWAMAAMSASALFLWSRGSRWHNRQAMRAAGQIDPALPKFPVASKVWHPLRTLATFSLISWGPPVRTVDGARRRYDAWKRLRRMRRSRATDPSPTPQAAPQPEPREVSADRLPDLDRETEADPRPDPPKPRQRTAKQTRPPKVRTLRSADDDQMLALLRQTFPDRTPSINEVQQTVGGGRSRAVRLRNVLTEGSGDDDQESEAVAA